METQPGSKTSEFQLTKWVFLAGAVLEGLSVIFAAVDSWDGVLGNGWIGAVLAGIGAAMQIAVALGYQRARASVKAAAELASGGASPSKP